jgi:hypothetical protein
LSQKTYKKAGIQVNEDVVANVNFDNVLNWALAILSPNIVFNEGLNDVFKSFVNNKLAICTIQTAANDVFSFVSEELGESVEAILIMSISQFSERTNHCEIFKRNNQSIFVFNDLQSVLVDDSPKQLSDVGGLASQSDVEVKGKRKR